MDAIEIPNEHLGVRVFSQNSNTNNITSCRDVFNNNNSVTTVYVLNIPAHPPCNISDVNCSNHARSVRARIGSYLEAAGVPLEELRAAFSTVVAARDERRASSGRVLDERVPNASLPNCVQGDTLRKMHGLRLAWNLIENSLSQLAAITRESQSNTAVTVIAGVATLVAQDLQIRIACAALALALFAIGKPQILFRSPHVPHCIIVIDFFDKEFSMPLSDAASSTRLHHALRRHFADKTILVLIEHWKYELQTADAVTTPAINGGQSLPRRWTNRLKPGSKLSMNALMSGTSRDKTSLFVCPACLRTFSADKPADHSGWIECLRCPSKIQISLPTDERYTFVGTEGPVDSTVNYQTEDEASDDDTRYDQHVEPMKKSAEHSNASIEQAIRQCRRIRVIETSASLETSAPVQAPFSDFVLALFDFTPANGHGICLAFKAGDIIHVLNRDGSGWWDGELNRKRGWFPSNYTESWEPDKPLLTPGYRGNSSVSSWNSIGTSSSSYSINASRFPVYNTLERVLKDMTKEPVILQPLLQGISLLKSAVVSHRSSHIQPSTACIISSVRNVLIRADCLRRESPTMQTNPPLAVEHKRILDDLSALVAQTRACSVAADSASDEEEEEQHAKLLTHALHVYLNTETFIDVAIKSGIDFSQLRNSYQSNGDRVEEDIGEGVASGWKSHVPRLDSAMDVETGERRLSGALTSDGERSESSAEHLLKRRGIDSKAGPSTRFAGRMPRQYHASSSKSKSSGDSHSPKSAPPRHGLSLALSGPCTPSEVLGYLRTLHDDLLGCVSRFVGKVHGHVPGDSNNGWKSEMVALTSALVMKVASLASIVNAILSAGGNTTRLRDTKEHLDVMVNALVDSVNQFATLDMSPPDSSDEKATSETHKQHTLQWVTGTLKEANECESALRLAILRNLPQDARIYIMPSDADGLSVPVKDTT